MSELFYSLTCGQDEQCSPTARPAYEFVLWRPSIGQVVPKGLRLIPYAVWWAFHHFRLFGNRDYCMVLAYDGARLIHRSCIFPRYFRFPFMSRADLQVGDTWTETEYRGQGIAKFALQEAVRLLGRPGKKFWYITERNNHLSVKVAEKAGFRLAGEGERISRFGIKILGQFMITKAIKSNLLQEVSC